MLVAHPAVLKDLIEEYETLQALYTGNGGRSVQQRLDDVSYTLCVSTGTRDIDTALSTARQQLLAVRTADAPVGAAG